MAERVGVRPVKMQRLAEKAWKSTEEMNYKGWRSIHHASHLAKEDGYPRVIKILMGRPYVFAKHKNRVVLLTVT